MVGASYHGVAATKDHGAVVHPSQLIASVRRTEWKERVRWWLAGVGSVSPHAMSHAVARGVRPGIGSPDGHTHTLYPGSFSC